MIKVTKLRLPNDKRKEKVMVKMNINPGKSIQVINTKAEQERLKSKFSYDNFQAIDVRDVQDLFTEQKYELKEFFIIALEKIYPLAFPMRILEMSKLDDIDVLCGNNNTVYYFTMLPLPQEIQMQKREAETAFQDALYRYAEESGHAGEQMMDWIMDTTLSSTMQMPELLPENQQARLRLLTKAEEILAVMQNICHPHSCELNNWYRKIASLCITSGWFEKACHYVLNAMICQYKVYAYRYCLRQNNVVQEADIISFLRKYVNEKVREGLSLEDIVEDFFLLYKQKYYKPLLKKMPKGTTAIKKKQYRETYACIRERIDPSWGKLLSAEDIISITDELYPYLIQGNCSYSVQTIPAYQLPVIEPDKRISLYKKQETRYDEAIDVILLLKYLQKNGLPFTNEHFENQFYWRDRTFTNIMADICVDEIALLKKYTENGVPASWMIGFPAYMYEYYMTRLNENLPTYLNEKICQRGRRAMFTNAKPFDAWMHASCPADCFKITLRDRALFQTEINTMNKRNLIPLTMYTCLLRDAWTYEQKNRLSNAFYEKDLSSVYPPEKRLFDPTSIPFTEEELNLVIPDEFREMLEDGWIYRKDGKAYILTVSPKYPKAR